MRSWPRQFSRFSINIGGQSSFWQEFSKLQKQHLCALQLTSLCVSMEESCCCNCCNQQILVLAWTISWLWVGLSDQLLLLFLGALSLKKDAPPLLAIQPRVCFQNNSLSRLRYLRMASYSLMDTFSYYYIWFYTLLKNSPRLYKVLKLSEIFANILQDFITQ